MRRILLPVVISGVALGFGAVQAAEQVIPNNGGPYNAAFMPGGIGISRDLPADSGLLAEGAPFSMVAWVRPDSLQKGVVTLVALGDPAACRCLALKDGRPVFIQGNKALVSGRPLNPGQWTHVALSSNGKIARLYINGRQADKGRLRESAVSAHIAIAPVRSGRPHFGGKLVDAKVSQGALSSDQVAAIVDQRPDFDVVHIWDVGVGWQWQYQANTGIWRPQDPWTLPQSKARTSAPVAKPLADTRVLEPIADNRWQLNGWRLAVAGDVQADGAILSQPGYDTSAWYAATVPGTVLTTLVDRGVYPDPYYGLNNLAIPEKLARQDYWYRTQFHIDPENAGKTYTLIFNGINYASEVWVNGKKLGGTKGAFIRGQFEITPEKGENVVAVKVFPPPHPGTPHEQSITAGVGKNGGQLAIDGPTFVATEGWDWIPGIRDRDTGIWLPVELKAHGKVRILDPQIITDLPLPRTDRADVYITVPIENLSNEVTSVTVTATFDDIMVSQRLKVEPGVTRVHFSPEKFAPLVIKNPELWWPNGYGAPALHDLRIDVAQSNVEGEGKNATVTDVYNTRFGIREVSYDLSLFDSKGELRRVNVQTTNGKLNGEKLIDVSHEAIKQSPNGWAESLTAAGEHSAAVRTISETLPEPHLSIRVNGVRIAARGGNWGMDDAMKRVSREKLEPYFRLERDAHMNIIRNWMGTNTEPQFYDLADEYGMMVMNDFWQSTQNFQVEPQDPALFLDNVKDSVARYRNHPSIILWFGRNEGVPYPALNEGLDDTLFALDGTRWYTGSSNVVNLQGSGPYNYRPPEGYFTDLASGFSVEVGTPSLATLDSVKASVPAADLWPLSDALAYHDWHFGGNGDTKTFMLALEQMFGAATSFEDFERKAQMMNLETHKAMFEGFLGHLWSKNSGRLLWMTHPAWPSNAWQIYSSDYDTPAAYYGSKKAAEPVHIQVNLPDNALVVVNTTRKAVMGLSASVRVTDLAGQQLYTARHKLDALANRSDVIATVPLDEIFAEHPMVLLSLRLESKDGNLVSENFYWRGRDKNAYRALNDMPVVPLSVSVAKNGIENSEHVLSVTLENPANTPALNAKLTLVDKRGERVLPAYYSDNYLSLLPGEKKTISVRYPVSAGVAAGFTLRGWNITADASE